MTAIDFEKGKGFERLIVKIGSALLAGREDGSLRRDWLASLAAEVAALRAAGRSVLLVSSGAVALGGRRLGIDNPRSRLDRAQAAAAAGQIALAHAYEEAFRPHGVEVAQVLLTLDDLEDRKRYLNARDTLDTLLGLGALPVINENDTVATSEIRFGDNDRLAARVAELTGADVLILLSDVDGLYDADPNKNADAALVPLVSRITEDIEAIAGPSQYAGFGSGGMVSKLAAAKIATRAGCRVIIADGRPEAPLAAYQHSGRGTVFEPASSPVAARKAWLHNLQAAAGTLHVDAGAVEAMHGGKSLLAAGVRRVDGAFARGDLVLVKDGGGALIGKGLVAYAREECERIMGRKSGEIADTLGYPGRGPVIHRDNFVLEK